MADIIQLRIFSTAAILGASTACTMSLIYMKFPGSLAVAIPAVAVAFAAVWFIQRQEKTARFEIYYSAVQEFGTPLSFHDLEASFERNGTCFDVEFPQGENNLFFRVTFRIPKLYEKFSIQSRNLKTIYHDDCYALENSPLPPQYLLQSREPDFLLDLLKNREVFNEVLYYETSAWKKLSISFNDGNFEFIWTPPVSDEIEGFRQICRSAFVFHDALKKLAEKI